MPIIPQSTEVKRQLSKTQLYELFDWKPSQRDSFEGDVSRIDFLNWIATRTLSSNGDGTEIKEIFIIEVSLKNRYFDPKNIVLLAKSIPQLVIHLLSHENKHCVTIYHTKLFLTKSHQILTPNSSFIAITGLNLDAVWQPIDSSIFRFAVEQENSPDEQISVDEESNKLLRQIVALERLMNTNKQPQRKREPFLELQKMKGGLNG